MSSRRNITLTYCLKNSVSHISNWTLIELWTMTYQACPTRTPEITANYPSRIIISTLNSSSNFQLAWAYFTLQRSNIVIKMKTFARIGASMLATFASANPTPAASDPSLFPAGVTLPTKHTRWFSTPPPLLVGAGIESTLFAASSISSHLIYRPH